MALPHFVVPVSDFLNQIGEIISEMIRNVREHVEQRLLLGSTWVTIWTLIYLKLICGLFLSFISRTFPAVL